jgi:hypothetical protein
MLQVFKKCVRTLAATNEGFSNGERRTSEEISIWRSFMKLLSEI